MSEPTFGGWTPTELRAALCRATNRPWHPATEPGGRGGKRLWHLVVGARGPVVARTGANDMPGAQEDAALIASAVNALEPLLDERDRLAAQLLTVEAALRDLFEDYRTLSGLVDTEATTDAEAVLRGGVEGE